MIDQDFLLFIHLLLFCYWLGGDIGVFYSSGFAANPNLSNEARMTAAKIMLGLDIIPRACGALMLSVGLFLSQFIGVVYLNWQLYLFFLVAPLWLVMELILHYQYESSLGQYLKKFDAPFKGFIILGCLALVTWMSLSGRLHAAPWVGYKIIIFAIIIFCSLLINRAVLPYLEGIQRIAEGNINQQENLDMAESLRKTKWAVIAIWICLLIEVALGIAKPSIAI
ncbi:MAG: hypothetical protein VYA80_01495 [Pseudomonadota bacterium]|nr:hypothetical protein [Pseudomonadota bacterium]